MTRLKVPDFNELLRSAKASALHLEMRDSYAVGREVEQIAAWREAGYRREIDPESDYWKPWLDLIREVTSKGVAVRRARVYSEPASEYVRFEHSGTQAVIDAGEEVRWLPRSKASALALPGNDFWLIDDKAVRFNLFTGEGGLADPQYTEDNEVISLCRTSFERVWRLATPHDQITL
ncbi:hypothetical protein GCM10009839_70240 [Catenulispora yoronensis]|uniref:DUF6879 domain-containing protein n=1 Tax=Catenulispora yoronensis TaxID=450799 RepID=A0ABN2V6V6_9ACTN